MRKALLSLAMATISAGACSSDNGPSGPQNLTLKHDSYPVGPATFQTGFSAGDAAAVIFAPRAGGYLVQHIQFLFGGGGTNQTVTLVLAADTGGAIPGAPIFTADYDLTPTDNAFNDIDLTSDSVFVVAGQALRVTIFVPHTGAPGVAVDSGGIGTQRNAVYLADTWSYAEDESVAGDFIIRALIVTE